MKKIYNETKTQIIENPDLTNGYLKDDKILIKTIPPQEEVKEVCHYEYVEYENGGKDRIKIVDTPYSPAKEKEEIFEDIKIYIPYSQKELITRKINELEKKLKDYDYIGVKIATGRGTIEEYKTQIAEMSDWANQINSLRNCLKTLD